MHSISTSNASIALSPKDIQVGRMVATGTSRAMAISLAAIAYPVDRRDDVSALANLTASRVAGSSNLGALARG